MKKGLIKASLISFFLLSILGIVLFSLFSSAYSSEKTYNVGEGIHIPLGEEGDYVLRVVAPSEEFVIKGTGNSIDYIPKEVGIYKFYISYNGTSEESSFNITEKKENPPQSINENITTNYTENYTDNYTSSELVNEGYRITEQVEIDKPVKWENPSDNSSEDKFTPPPQTKEEDKGELGKDVVVYSEENISYENVLVHSEVDGVIKVGEENEIKVYWEENESYVNFEAKDKDNDNYIDEVQWIVPNLSAEQTFNIIIISKAEHLASDRTFISDIYEQVKALDDIWSETINSNEYVRITFEKNLTKDNDITIFPRVTSGNPIIEVYEKDDSNILEKFENISSNQYNKIFLTKLQGEQDTFDLKVVGGAVEFDHIIDPTFTKRTYAFYNYQNHTMAWGRPQGVFWLNGTNVSAANYTNVKTIDTNYATVCSTGAPGDFEIFQSFNFTINEPPASINWINITWRGNYTSNGERGNLYFFNQTSQGWINYSVISGAIANYTVNYTTPYQISNLVGANKQLVIYSRGENFDAADCLNTDYAEVLVGFTDNNPQWFSNLTNGTATGSYVLHSLNLTDQIALSGYVFEFDNGTGTFVNNSFIALAGTQGWSNVSKWINTTVGSNIRWRVYTNDSLNQWNSTGIFTYKTTDIIKPYFTTIPANASLFYANQSLLVTFAAADNSGFGYYRINDTRFLINQTGFLSNATSIAVGNYEINVTINDTSNNINWTRYTVQVNKSQENCQVLYNASSPITFPATFLVWANCTSPFVLARNGTTITNNSVQSLAVGAYNFSMSRNDSSNYTSYYNETLMRVIDTTSPRFTTIPSNASLFYANQSLLVQFTGTDETGFGYYRINDTRFLINQTGFLFNATPMAVGNYVINVTINDTYNNINWTRYTVQINKSNYFDCGVYFNATSPINYPDNLIAYTNCSSDYTFYVNQTAISNSSTINSGAGYYNLTVQRTDTTNYTNTFDDEFFTVNRNPENCQVLYNTTSPINYPDTFKVLANCTSPFVLARNGTTITNNSEQALAASAYNFSMSRNDSLNYTIYYNESQFRIVDTVSPQVVINSPKNITYHNPFDFPMILNISLNENGSVMYSIDDGLTNISLNTTNNKNFNGTLNAPIDGQYTFKIYANDTIGNNNYTEKVLFTVTTGDVVSQCRTLNSSGTYTLNQSIIGVGSCLNITASNIYLDCNGSSITYDTGGSSGVVGINASTISYTNLSIKNCFITKSSAAGTDGYGIYLNRTSNSVIFNNTISTNGTANNYGIYISINSVGNNITQNIIFSKGSTTNNIGVYLSKGATNTTVSFNNISSNGTITNYGIYTIGNATFYNSNNLFSYNNITTWGIGASNYGVYITSNSSLNTVTKNNITTNGTATNYGVYILGTAALATDNNNISNNFIQTFGATTDNYGIYITTNSSNNNIIGNDILTNGTTRNYGIWITTNSNNNNVLGNDIIANGTTTSYGIYLSGAAGNIVNNNTLDNNTIQTKCQGAASSCYGIYFQNNVNSNNITNSNISTNGTTNNWGIYLTGTNALTVNSNLIYLNNITTSGIGASNHGIYITSNSNNNNITANNILTRGTSTNYGVYLVGIANGPTNNNTIYKNSIQTKCSSNSNYGIYLLTNANQNNITNNTINTSGVTDNYGIATLGTTVASTGNNLINNIIRTNGTTNNWGIYFTANANQNNISGNDIITNGTTTGYGIYFLGAAGTSVNSNIIDNNSIQTRCSVAASNCYGIWLRRLTSQNNITRNNIITNGTTLNYGIYLIGTNTLAVNSNLIDSNTIITGGTGVSNHGILISTNSSYNIITNNTILANGSNTNYGINIIGSFAADSNSTLIDSNNITVVGTAAAVSNIGIWIDSNTSNNNITNNNVTVYGTSNSQGIELRGAAGTLCTNNFISSNNILVNGSAATSVTDYGIYFTANTNSNMIVSNNITTVGNTTGYGIYLSGGTAATPTNNNIISLNNITTIGRGASNYGIWLTSNANSNDITYNIIFTSGKTTNHGIYLTGTAPLTVNNNEIDSNTIQSIGNETNNYGIYLLTNCNQNNITSNTITTNGTTSNIGIYLSGITNLSNGNLIYNNTIFTNGATTNHGIYLTTNSSNNNITENYIIANGATTSYGVYLLGIANAPVNNNTMDNNRIQTRCLAAVSNCSGIYLQNNANFNKVTENNITTHGTKYNYGIYLLGTAALGLNSTLIDSNYILTYSPFDNGIFLSSYSNSTVNSNIINVLNADRIIIDSGYSNNNLTNNSFLNRNYAYYDINFTSPGNNLTWFIDQYLENYTFTGAGGKINVKNSQYGQINFIVAVNKSGTNFSNDIKISNNFVYVNSAQTGLNKSANITLYNLPVNFTNPIILKDGFACSVGVCYNFTSLNAGNVSFNVSSWSNYSVVENLPDLFINFSDINLSELNPIENQEVKINAIVENLGYGYAGNVLISFFEGDPFSSGISIGNVTINISGIASTEASILWNAKIGKTNIFVVADYYLLINESNEENNKANKTISINSWQEIYGNTSVDKIIGNETSNLKRWFNESSLQGNVFITDSESYVNWLSLQAIGKTKTGGASSNDFSEIDTLLGMTNFDDSVSNLFSNIQNPKNTQTMLIHQKEIQNVPIINSTNSSNFVTGILWDTSDDVIDGEYGPIDKEDLVFVAPVSKQSEGAYGFYNYEIKIPSKLREYNTLDSQEIYLYYDLN